VLIEVGRAPLGDAVAAHENHTTKGRVSDLLYEAQRALQRTRTQWC
jgi:hypothetical protein